MRSLRHGSRCIRQRRPPRESTAGAEFATDGRGSRARRRSRGGSPSGRREGCGTMPQCRRSRRSPSPRAWSRLAGGSTAAGWEAEPRSDTQVGERVGVAHGEIAVNGPASARRVVRTSQCRVIGTLGSGIRHVPHIMLVPSTDVSDRKVDSLADPFSLRTPPGVASATSRSSETRRMTRWIRRVRCRP